MNTRLISVLSFLALSFALGGCAAVDAGGRMVTGVGGWMTDYGNKHDNGLAKMGGNLYTNIGTGIQGAANSKKSVTPPADAAAAPAGNRTGRETDGK